MPPATSSSSPIPRSSITPIFPAQNGLRYTPNTDHKQSDDTVIKALPWIDDILDNKTSPNIEWKLTRRALWVRTSQPPNQCGCGKASNPDARDFRLETLGPVWTSQTLQARPNGLYAARLRAPARGWTAFMIEVSFETAGALEPEQVYTTGVQIFDTLPTQAAPAASARARAIPAAASCPPPKSAEPSTNSIVRGIL